MFADTTSQEYIAHSSCGGASYYYYYPANQWSNEQVLEWLRAVCHENNIDSGNLVGFAECTGLQLCSMSLPQFLELHPLHGNLFFRKFREYVEHQQRQVTWAAAQSITGAKSIHLFPCPHSTERHYHTHPAHRHPYHPHHPHPYPSSPPPSNHLIQNPGNGTTYHELLPRPPTSSTHDPLGHWQEPPYPGTDPYAYPMEGGLPYTPGDFGGAGHTTISSYQAAYPMRPEYMSSTSSSPSVTHNIQPQVYLQGNHLPPAGAPSSSTPPSTSPLSPQQDTRRDRGPKLWEFLLDLLEDPTSNPSIIRWENQEDRTFRLTSPHEVSYRWGQRRPNQNNLPYDYFARALRYHYKTGMLISVPERKLVYKFGSAVFQQRRRGPSTPLIYQNPESPHTDSPTGHPS